MDVPLTGQVMVEPRQWWPSVNYITARAIYNAKKVAIRLCWDDRTKSLGPPPATAEPETERKAPEREIKEK